jgi:hypothetical protein
MYQNYILLKILYIKMWFKAIFLPKSKSFHLFVVVFLCVSAGLGVIYDSQATNSSTDRGEGSHTEPSLLRIGRLGVTYDSLRHGNTFFIAIRITVKLQSEQIL